MNGQTVSDTCDLALKITRLVEERGWNQEDLARNAQLNRQTVRQILSPNKNRRLRNATISACARALGLTVSQLRTMTLERLLARIHEPAGSANKSLNRLYDLATQPQLVTWLEHNPDRAGQLTSEEMDELLSLQGTGGPLTHSGVERYVEQVERKRRLNEKIHAIAGTEYLELLEQLIALLYEKIQPYADRV